MKNITWAQVQLCSKKLTSQPYASRVDKIKYQSTSGIEGTLLTPPLKIGDLVPKSETIINLWLSLKIFYTLLGRREKGRKI